MSGWQSRPAVKWRNQTEPYLDHESNALLRNGRRRKLVPWPANCPGRPGQFAHYG
jgi:hypothetical protein